MLRTEEDRLLTKYFDQATFEALDRVDFLLEGGLDWLDVNTDAFVSYVNGQFRKRVSFLSNCFTDYLEFAHEITIGTNQQVHSVQEVRDNSLKFIIFLKF